MLCSAINSIVRELRNFFLLIFSVLFAVLGISSSNIFMCWIFVELNLVIFLGVLASSWNISQGKRLIYLVIQGVASGLFLWSFLLVGIRQRGQVVAYLAFLVKLAGAPFHLWFFKIIERLNWGEFFFISTRQKILPLFIIRNVSRTIWVGLARAIISFYHGFFIKELKMALGYSSLFGLGWILRGLSYSGMIFFLTIYAVGLYLILSRLFKRAKSKVSLTRPLLVESGIVLIGFLRVIGIPPLFGFWGKLARVILIFKISVVIPTALVLISVGLVFIYFRFIFNSILERGAMRALYPFTYFDRALVIVLMFSLILI